ncbi:hypothetical protein H8959_001438 [Pygathrix nigripes]
MGLAESDSSDPPEGSPRRPQELSFPSESSTASPSQRPLSSPQRRTPGPSATTQSGANVRDMEAAREILPRTSLFQARRERGSKAPDKALPLWLLKTDAPRIVDTAHGIHCDCHLPSGKNSAELELFKIFIPPRELPGPQRLMKQDDLIYNPYSKFPQNRRVLLCVRQMNASSEMQTKCLKLTWSSQKPPQVPLRTVTCFLLWSQKRKTLLGSFLTAAANKSREQLFSWSSSQALGPSPKDVVVEQKQRLGLQCSGVPDLAFGTLEAGAELRQSDLP